MQELTGTAYLALQHDPAYLSLLIDAIRRYGSNNPASRLNDFAAFRVLDQVEADLAEALGHESVCLFSSGFLAGVSVCNQLRRMSRERGLDLLFADNHHPSFAPSPECYTLPVSDAFKKGGAEPNRRVVICNSVDPFSGLPEAALFQPIFRDAAWRVVDISHTMFVWDHKTLNRMRGDTQASTVFFGSLGKAGAFSAGFVSGPEELIQALRKSPEYCAASPPAVSAAAAFLAAGVLRQTRRAALWDLMEWCDARLQVARSAEFRFPTYPLGASQDALHQELLDTGFCLSYLSYPAPSNPKRLRLVLNAGVSRDSILPLIALLERRGTRVEQHENTECRWLLEKSHQP